MKRKYPLFIIDDSRSHGRGRETDFISCTSAEYPFVASVTYITDGEHKIDRDNTRDSLAVYSDSRQGIRVKIKIEQIEPGYKLPDVRNLLKRALKEYLIRHQPVEVDLSDVSDEAVIKFCDMLLQQTYENLREKPGDTQAKTVKAILEKIKSDYESD